MQIKFNNTEVKKMVRDTKIINEERKRLRGEKYKYLIRCLKKEYNNQLKKRDNVTSYDRWNYYAKENGIYYIVEQNQDIINLQNWKMVDAILAGKFDRYDYVSIVDDEK